MKQVIQAHITLFLMLHLAVSVTAQKKPNFPQQIFGNGGHDIAKHIIQNKQGQYVIVGSTANWFLRGDVNIFFTKIDSAGRTVLKATPIGGPRTEGANSVVQTRDGGYVIAGFTDSVEQGKREAWLVKVTESGLRIWDTKISTPEDDEFTDVTEAPNGDLWMTGQSGDKLWVVKTDAQGKKEKDPFFFKPADATNCIGNALAWDAKGRILTIVGSKVLSYQNGRRDLILLPFDTVGEDFLDGKDYPNAEGEDIVRDRIGNFGIIGTSYTDIKGDFLFMYVNTAYDTITLSRFGKKGVIDKGMSIAQDENGHFVLVGETYEDKRYQTTEGWVHRIKSDGSPVSGKPQTFGTSGNDAFLDVVTSEKGDIKIVGKKYELKGLNSEGWLLTIPPSVSPQNKGKIDLEIKGDRFHDDEDSTLLRKGKYGFYGFWIENKDTNDVFGLVAKVTQTQYKQKNNVHDYDKLVIGTLRAKERRLITVPFYGSQSLIRDEWDFNVKFLAQKDTLALQHNFHISTRDFLRHKLDTTHTFPPDIWAGRVVNFSFTVKNTGDLMAQKVQLRIDPQAGTRIKMLGKDRIDLDDIPIGETRTANISFEVDKDFVSEVLLLPVFVQANGVKYGVEYQLVARVHPDTVHKVAAYVKKPVRLIWAGGKDSLIVTKLHQPLQLIVESDNSLNRKDNITVLINGNPNAGEKFDNVRLLETKSAGTYQHRYQLVFDPSLQIGRNEIKVVVDDGNDPKQARLLIQRVNPPNLYLLSVGVDYTDNKNISSLSFTGTDAISIDSIFKTQKGKIFGKVTTIQLTNPLQTTGSYIKQQLIYLANVCKANDVFIVMLSGHGGIMDFTSQSVQFFGSDYDPANPNTYLDYRTDIKAILDNAKGQKLLFLDACQKKVDKSVASLSDEENQLSEAIENIIKATPAFRALLSCSKGQSSWEVGKYGHGAFTQAILESLRNQTVPCGENEGDCNANIDPSGAKPTNRFLTFKELADFVIKRVPTIVKEIGLRQTPTVRDEHSDEDDIPLFWFDNN